MDMPLESNRSCAPTCTTIVMADRNGTIVYTNEPGALAPDREATPPESVPEWIDRHFSDEVARNQARQFWQSTVATAPATASQVIQIPTNRAGETHGTLQCDRMPGGHYLLSHSCRPSTGMTGITATSDDNLFECVFNNVYEALAIHDEQGNILRVNGNFLDLFQVTGEFAIGRNIDQFADPEHPMSGKGRLIERALAGEPVFTEWIARVPDKEERIQTEIALNPVDMGGQRYILASIRDISGRKSLEIQLHRSKKLEAIGTLAAGISHDFNNILGAILGYAQIEQINHSPHSESFDNMTQIIKASRRGADMIRQILTFSRKGNEKPRVINLGSVVREAMRLLRATIPQSTQFEIDIPDQTYTILANPTEIHQIVMNLCTNAHQALQQQRGTVQVAVSAGAEPPNGLPAGHYAQIRVLDSGPGIDESQMDKIFDPYFTTKAVGEGTGMGLAVVHGIVSRANGTITVENRAEGGACFAIWLPLVEERESDPSMQFNTLPGGRERILLVDDEPDLVRAWSKILESLGYTVAGETDPETALRLFNSKPRDFDLLITDQNMPGMTGDQLTGACISLRPDLPVIIWTGFGDLMSEQEAREVGALALVLKPVEQYAFCARIRALLDAVQPDREAPNQPD